MNTILEQLYQGETLTQAESHQLFTAIITGQLEPTQLAVEILMLLLPSPPVPTISAKA